MTNPQDEPKKQIAIYRINKENSCLVDEPNKLEKLKEFLLNARKYFPMEKTLKSGFFSNYNSCFILYKNITGTKWENFVNKIVDENLDFGSYSTYSAILLLEKDAPNKNIYAVTFGNVSYHILKDFIDDSFGLDILSRIIDTSKSTLKASKGQNVVGTTQGEISIYRQLYSLDEIEDFGKIFQELNVVLKKGVLEKFGIAVEDEIKNCCAKSSFLIKSAISPLKLEQYLNGCEYALTLESKPINATKKLDKKKDKVLIEALEAQLVNNMFECLQQTSSDTIFDISHKEFEKYLQAYEFKLKFERKREVVNEPIIKIEQVIQKLFPDGINNAEKLKDLLDKGKITTLNEEGFIITDDTIKKHIFAEESIGDKKYFLLNGDWLLLEASFLKSLDDKIGNYEAKGLYLSQTILKPWGSCASETDYNNQHSQDNTIIVHPYKYKNIEICDIINWDDNNLYLYFIKQGFGSSVRDLTYQVYTSAKLIENSVSTDSSYLRGFYAQYNAAHPCNIDENDFINLFKKKIQYVFAFYDNNGSRRLISNPEAFGSNIAKFALIDLVERMNNMNKTALKIYQIL